MWFQGSMRRTAGLNAPRRTRHPDVARLLYGKRKNLVHRVSEAKPSVTAMLAQTPTEELSAAIQRAVSVNELDREQIAAVLKQHRALRRLDRTEVVVQALRKVKQPLTSQHYCLLMAHANDARQTRTALQFWKDAVAEGKANNRLHGALLSTYRNAGNWKAAVRHCEGLWKDQQTLDPLAVHATMNACRRYGPWQAGLHVFTKAVEHGSKPNSVVYLELLRIIARSQLAGRWSYGLAILRALEGNMEVTAGHYNAVLSTMGGGRWAEGVALFHSMQRNNVQPSTDTLTTVQQLCPHSVSHCIRCVAEAHALGMPVTDSMYRNVLLNLFRMQLNHEATQFAEREYQLDRLDAGNPITHTLALSIALVDALLAHPRPHDALLVYQSFQDKIGDVVAAATRQLGTTGALDQRWLVEGRVAVVDHNVLLSTTFESLIHHYDSIFIPFASVRLLARRSRENGDSVQGRYMKTALRRISLLLKREEWRMLRVLPFAHQLLAHTHLSEGGPSSPEDLHALRAEAEKQDLLPRSTADNTAPPFSTSTTEYAQALLSRLAPCGDAEAATAGANDKVILIRDNSLPAAHKHQGSFASGIVPPSSVSVVPGSPLPAVLFSPQRITSVERVTAVAAMLKSLNPDAHVHVLSTLPSQLASVKQWNRVRSTTPLVAVHYPDQLFRAAPPSVPISDEKTPSTVARRGGG